MYINASIAISTEKVLLVPYEEHHVPPYHEWMKDPEIQTLTASKPLTLPEEHAMQKSWRTDGDKLTFIICLPLSDPPPHLQSPPSPQSIISIKPRVYDTPERMIGDINMFLSLRDEDDDEEVEVEGKRGDEHPSLSVGAEKEEGKAKLVVGEIEIMIAPIPHRHNGHGRAALLSFITYISHHLPSILSEYSSSLSLPSSLFPENTNPNQNSGLELKWLSAKISKENVGSLRLFESVGFVRRGGVNWFGEVKVVFEIGGVERWGSEGWREVGYGGEEVEVGEGKGV